MVLKTKKKANAIPPNARLKLRELVECIIENSPPKLVDSKNGKWSKQFKAFVSTCLVKDPSKRPSAEQLLKDKFITKYEGKTLGKSKSFKKMVERHFEIKQMLKDQALAEDSAQFVQKFMLEMNQKVTEDYRNGRIKKEEYDSSTYSSFTDTNSELNVNAEGNNKNGFNMNNYKHNSKPNMFGSLKDLLIQRPLSALLDPTISSSSSPPSQNPETSDEESLANPNYSNNNQEKKPLLSSKKKQSECCTIL